MASGEWERSAVLGGYLLRPSSVTPLPGVAAFSFPGDAVETGSLGEVVSLEALTVLVMVSGIRGGEAAVQMANVGDIPRCREVVRRTLGAGRMGGIRAAPVVVGVSTVNVVGFTAVIADGSSISCPPYVGFPWRRLVAAVILASFVVGSGVRLRW